MQNSVLQDDCVYIICCEQPTVGVNIASASPQSLAAGGTRPSLLAAPSGRLLKRGDGIVWICGRIWLQSRLSVER